MVNTPASVSRRSRTVSTELAMPSVSRNSLYRHTPDMTASLTMVRFHSSPSSPSATALEFSVTGTCSWVAVIVRLRLGPDTSPARDGLARRPAAMGATGDPFGKLSARDRAAAHVVGPEHDDLGQIAVHIDRERHEIRVVLLDPADARGHTDLAAEHARLPPMFSVAKVRALSTWVSPAWPVTWRAASRSMRTPLAPTGWPTPIRPPLGLTGIAPSRSRSPFSTAFQLSPGPVMPKWSMAMYSDIEKQSWVSMPSSAWTSVTLARRKASVTTFLTCGKT